METNTPYSVHRRARIFRAFTRKCVLTAIFIMAVTGKVTGAVSISNTSFETPVVGSGNFQYSPSGASWSFSGSGISGNSSGFTGGNGSAPHGSQVAFIQGNGSFSQTLSGFSSGTGYTVQFSAAQRNYTQPGQTWRVMIDSTTVGEFSPAQSATAYTDYAVTFTTITGSHSLKFEATNQRGGDNTVLIDNIRITESAATPTAPIGLTGSPISSSQAIVVWMDNSGNESGFKIERKQHSNGTYSEIGTVGANVTMFQDNSLPVANVNFYYRVRAYNAVGNSPYTRDAVVNSSVTAVPATDYQGRPIITQAAPSLPFTRQTAPRLTGIDYTFQEQTARGAAVISRFPAFTLSDRRVHVDGPWYNSPSANLHFTRGITSIGAMPNYRLSDSAPTTLRKLPQARKWQLMTDPIWYSYADILGDELSAQTPSDSRIPALRALSEQHVFSNDESAYRELGRRTFAGERWPTDITGEGVLFPCLDIESTGNWQYQRNCFGWLYQGMAEAAASFGVSIRPLLYGQYQFHVGVVSDSMRYGGTGDPEYLLPEKDFLAAPDPTLEAAQANNGIISMDGYLQAMWGHEPFYKRNADGSLQLSGGLPIFNDITTTTTYGINLTLEAGEAQQCLEDMYRQATRMYLQHYRRAGQYPSNSTLRKSFLTNCTIGAWSRYTNEGVLSIHQNDRPLPDWQLDMLLGIYLFTAEDIVMWSSDMNYVPGALGANYSQAWQYNAHGVFESTLKPLHRYSALDPIHNGDFQWCWFSLPMVNKNLTAGDRYFEKPIAMGKLRQFEGNTWLELFTAFPALDGKSGTMKVWVDKDGVRSSAYTVKIQNGRSYFLDAWQLPSSFTNLEGKHIWLRFTDLLGNQRTWRGDWRSAANNTVTTPSDYVVPTLTGFAGWQQLNFGSTTAPNALSTADPDRDNLTNLLEYGLGTNPQQASPLSQPNFGMISVGTEQYLTLTFTRSAKATDVSMTVQVAGSPSAWSDGSRYGNGGDVTTNGFTTQVSRTNNAGVETITVRDNLSRRANPTRFMRLKVTMP